MNKYEILRNVLHWGIGVSVACSIWAGYCAIEQLMIHSTFATVFFSLFIFNVCSVIALIYLLSRTPSANIHTTSRFYNRHGVLIAVFISVLISWKLFRNQLLLYRFTEHIDRSYILCLMITQYLYILESSLLLINLCKALVFSPKKNYM